MDSAEIDRYSGYSRVTESTIGYPVIVKQALGLTLISGGVKLRVVFEATSKKDRASTGTVTELEVTRVGHRISKVNELVRAVVRAAYSLIVTEY